MSYRNIKLGDLPEKHRLHFLDVIERHAFTLENAHDRTQQRIAENRKIATAAARGEKIAVVWSGRDCDGVSYSGDVTLVDATRNAVDDHIKHTYDWADGPCNYCLVSIAESKYIDSTSRDLTMEAFENGHAHCIHG